MPALAAIRRQVSSGVTVAVRARILREIARVLAPGGRYGFHEMVTVPDDLDGASVDRIHRDLSSSIRVGARPLPRSAWRTLLEGAGLEVRFEQTLPMRLLDANQVWRDEGLGGAARIGLQPRDIIVELNGTSVASTETLEGLVAEDPSVWRVEIERDGQRIRQFFR